MRGEVGRKNRESAELGNSEKLRHAGSRIRRGEQQRKASEQQIKREGGVSWAKARPRTELPSLDRPQNCGRGEDRITPLGVFVKPGKWGKPRPRQQYQRREVEGED